jgi:hypothetical protein
MRSLLLNKRYSEAANTVATSTVAKLKCMRLS